MHPIWLDSYPDDVPHEIDPTRYRSLNALLEESFQRHAAATATVCMDHPMRYGELDRLSTALGAYLQSLGLAPGARVALMLPNLPSFPVAIAGVLRAGLTCVNVNPLYTARELQHQLQDSGAEAIVILENFAHTLQAVIDQTSVQHVVVTRFGDLLGPWRGPWTTFAVRHLLRLVPRYRLPSTRTVVTLPQALQRGATQPLHAVAVDRDSIAFLQYTGGTTGLSKGAILTHGNVIAAALQADAWFSPALRKASPDGDVSRAHHIMALPLYHIFALTLLLLVLRHGAHATLVPNPRDIPAFVAVLRRRPFHVLPAVNTLFNALLNDPGFRRLDFSSLVLSQAGGMAASDSTARQWQALTGRPMIEGWGMSETCAIGTNNRVTDTAFSGTIGLPLPSVSIAIKDDAGQDLPLGDTGEICVRGPNVMRGYHRQPAETAQAFTADGYLRTGDIGCMDAQGYIRLLDRKKDMVIVSGFNVYPAELDQVIARCPGVRECATVGVPDAHSGEAIEVWVVRSDPALTEAEVLRFCHEQLTGYKRPKHVRFCNELPKTAVGKVLRRALKTP